MNCCTYDCNEQLHWRVKDIRGQRFGRWIVESHAGVYATNRTHFWNCICDCGIKAVVSGVNLRSGASRSCGCLHREVVRAAGDRSRTHGMTRTSTYAIWRSMLARCHNPGRKDFARYGGRGITVCERWRTFDNFLADMGERPAHLSIDRINNDGDYEPGNCRWATRSEQQRNKTRRTLT